MTDQQPPEPYFIRKHCRECEGWTTQLVTIQYGEDPREITAIYDCSKCDITTLFSFTHPTPQDIIDGK